MIRLIGVAGVVLVVRMTPESRRLDGCIGVAGDVNLPLIRYLMSFFVVRCDPFTFVKD